MGNRQVGHLDPYFQALMLQIQEQLRYVWQTSNETILPVFLLYRRSMAYFPGIWHRVVRNGINFRQFDRERGKSVDFSEWIFWIANEGNGGASWGRVRSTSIFLLLLFLICNCRVVVESIPWGTVFTLDQIRAEIEKHQPVIVGIVHAETSTGHLLSHAIFLVLNYQEPVSLSKVWASFAKRMGPI